jgi:hypothetical protein
MAFAKAWQKQVALQVPKQGGADPFVLFLEHLGACDEQQIQACQALVQNTLAQQDQRPWQDLPSSLESSFHQRASHHDRC